MEMWESQVAGNSIVAVSLSIFTFPHFYQRITINYKISL